jgi:surfactin synthase thioesterase subunit
MNTWLSFSKPPQKARLRLFCFPHAGGGASLFRTWTRDLPADVHVCAIRLPGREGRITEAPFTRLQPLVQTLRKALWRYLDIPFAFFGHSLGALVAFELAREIAARNGTQPSTLFVSGHRAPQIPYPRKPICALPPEEFLQELRHLGGTPVEVLQSPELMDLLLPVLRADFAVCETYVYESGERLQSPISAFGGSDDPEVSNDDLTGWGTETDASFKLRILPGDHFFFLTARDALLEAVSQDLMVTLRKLEPD